MTQDAGKARLVGINHVALEVGDIDAALAFYGRLFDFALRGRSETMAFIDMGDQFIALAAGREQPKDQERHFGLVVDDRVSLRRALEAAGAASTSLIPGATTSRWSSTATFSSLRRRRSCVPWRSVTSARRRTRCRS
jgi:catechol 2,3-dioxygenase-like lactoylglutathione lyase family enzyme